MTTLERLKFGKEAKDSVTLLPCFYFVELPILALAVISLYFLELTDIFQPVHSGYSCNDKSLSLPYIIPQKEVCPLPLLFSLVFAIPTATILVGEAILFCYLSRRSSSMQTEANINAAGCNFNSYIRRVVRFIGVHIFGLCVTALITDIFQLSTGQHAPYWLDVCKPNLTNINISTCDEAFILDDICSGQDIILIIAGRKSFPSQHASMAGFAAVYVSIYLNTVLTDSTKLLKPLLVFSFIMFAILAGLTRIIQFRNHPVDVYCGWILGIAVATYLGFFAVGSFQPSEDKSKRRLLPLTLGKPLPSSFHSVCQSEVNNSHQVGHHMLTASQPEPVNTRTISHTFSPEQKEQILKRSSSYREPSQSNLKIANADLEMIAAPSPVRNCDKTFSSSTLPRSHGGSSLEGCRVPRRHASIHSSMDSTRSKQLLSQWKNKNDKRKLSLQAMDGIRPVSLSPQRDVQQHYLSESSAIGLDTELQGGTHLPSPTGQEGSHIPASYIKIAASCVPIANKKTLTQNEGIGFAVGPRMIIQSRPGSSQLVHIPEEENSTTKDQESESEESALDVVGSAKQKWMRVSEKTTIPCRPLSAGGQPRLMQVIAFSKQQGLLNSRSEDGGSTVSCTGSIRYRALMDQESSPPASTTGAMEGQGLERTGSIVRVEAHPESNKPVVKPPSTDGSGSWRWNPGEKRPLLQQSVFNINDLHRNTDSCDFPEDAGSLDGWQSVTGTKLESKGVLEGGVHTISPHAVYPFHQSPNFQDPNSSKPVTPSAIFAPPFHHHPQSITTIRVTPVESTGASSDGSSDSQSAASSSRESTLRRKSGTNIHFTQDQGLTTDHILYEKSNLFQENLKGFQGNPNHCNRQLQGMFSRSGRHPPPTLPRPLMTHSPPPTLGLAFKES
ncbi:phospholipid phosphatase-related protein type 4-like isoform X1 [Phyllopteryx taeniolatus]|uniref:phospholipid phosphatase-related protein type 4-like isoform X1 n=1 Tax=Phyllopteryx taeniolatus TaxID=161469 RepID=UPI002AD2A986|nr:phospholipid phosphatase-related protein type 4-like isoform X1 [Phyllopteryx taeniolatus]